MDMSGEQRIPAPREAVWQALNDPEILRRCIPGCQALTKTSDTEMTAQVVLKVGPVSARFEGVVTLSDLDPPNGYRISGEGQGGVAGFARGEALVRLEEAGGETLLRYQVAAEVGGRLAQLGARLIDATARQMSAAFFKRFAAEIAVGQGQGQGDGAGAEAPASAAVPDGSADGRGRSVPPGTPLRPGHPPPPQAAPSRRILGVSLALLVAALAVLLFALGGRFALPAGGISPDFAGAVLLLVVAAIGYLFGRLGAASAPVVVLDRDLLDAMAERRGRP